MKKISFLILIFLCFSLSGCIFQNPKYISFSKKPSDNYYTSSLYDKFLENNNYSVSIFDTNLYKNIQVSDDEKKVIENFIKSLSDKDFQTSDINDTQEPYRIKILFSDGSKYVIKVFNNKNVSIFPWDGCYSEDYVNIEDVPLGYNLYDFCNHVHNKPQQK